MYFEIVPGALERVFPNWHRLVGRLRCTHHFDSRIIQLEFCLYWWQPGEYMASTEEEYNRYKEELKKIKSQEAMNQAIMTRHVLSKNW